VPKSSAPLPPLSAGVPGRGSEATINLWLTFILESPVNIGQLTGQTAQALSIPPGAAWKTDARTMRTMHLLVVIGLTYVATLRVRRGNTPAVQHVWGNEPQVQGEKVRRRATGASTRERNAGGCSRDAHRTLFCGGMKKLDDRTDASERAEALQMELERRAEP
jgi:anti-sigma-K factor RskA